MNIQKKYDPLFLLFLLIGLTAIVWLYFAQGIGLTNDSGFYVYSGCYHFLSEPTGKTLTIFPPLYPALIGLLNILPGLSPLIAASILNLLAYLYYAYGIGISGQEHFNTSFYRYLFYAISLLGIPILFNAYMLWSEMLFIALLWNSLRYLTSFLQKENKNDLTWFATLFLLCFFTRYAALGLLPGIGLVLLFRWKKENLKVYLICAALTVGMPLLWLIRNKLVNPAAPYDPATLTLSQNILQHTETFSHFIIANNVPDLTGSLAMIGLLIVLVVAAWKDKDRIRIIHSTVIISYTLFLIILNSIKDIQVPDERYYSILYPSLFLAFFLSIEKRQSNASALSQKLIMGILLLWTIYPMARSYKNTAEFIRNGIGYQEEKWRTQPIILQSKNLQGKIISNNPLPIILLAERAATTHTVDLKASNEALYLIWWTFDGLPYLPSDKEKWTKYYKFEELYSSSEGSIYRLIKK